MPPPAPGVRLGPAVAPPGAQTSYIPDETDDGAAPPARRKGRVLPLLVAVLALGGFAAIVWYAYSWGTGDVPPGELPVVTAEQDLNDVKERPEEPGGMEVPHQDAQVLNDRGSDTHSTDTQEGQLERLLPPPESPQPPEPVEEPLAETPPVAASPQSPATDPQSPATDEGGTAVGDLPTEPPAAPQVGEAVDPSVAEAPAEAPPVPAADQPASAAPGSDDTVEVAEQPVVPPQPETSDSTAPAAPVDPAAPGTASTDLTPPAPPVPEPSTAEEAAPDPTVASPEPAAAPATEPATAASGPASVQSGDWVLQMAALRDRGAVDAEWARLQAKHPDLLSNLSLAVQTVNVEGQGAFHRLQAGPLPNRATATDLCGLLQGSGTDCLAKQH
ncbi:SPOR domain-containing protein [Algihabitans albus]|uniref:SPOR domain-containing protein n=1 Tax=Algihabitans albus TaxID=2164067 RepID=UPI000E5CF176|nr:SPOR domain-containing protein [Algihabitans albus]